MGASIPYNEDICFESVRERVATHSPNTLYFYNHGHITKYVIIMFAPKYM